MFELTVRQKIAALVLLVFLALGGVLLFLQDNRRPVAVISDGPAQGELMVHVCGAVVKPGVYTLKPGARKITALETAGGALPEADLNCVNLAEFILDGEQVYVPQKGEVVPLSLPNQTKKTSAPRTTLKASPAPKEQGPFDMNRVTVVQLETIPGIGPALANQIVAFRAKKGRFEKYEDLLEMPGIGPSKLEKFRPFLYVTDETKP